jgi:hypothetical protein
VSTGFNPRHVIGRRIVAVEMNTVKVKDEGYGGRMHDPRITLDDGSTLRFVVEEHPEGAEYGVNIVRHNAPSRRKEK